jgi:hypothetical protein
MDLISHYLYWCEMNLDNAHCPGKPKLWNASLRWLIQYAWTKPKVQYIFQEFSELCWSSILRPWIAISSERKMQKDMACEMTLEWHVIELCELLTHVEKHAIGTACCPLHTLLGELQQLRTHQSGFFSPLSELHERSINRLHLLSHVDKTKSILT